MFSLPDVEVFHSSDYNLEQDNKTVDAGFYWWSCFQGCLPNGDPVGPFVTEKDAIASAQDI